MTNHLLPPFLYVRKTYLETAYWYFFNLLKSKALNATKYWYLKRFEISFEAVKKDCQHFLKINPGNILNKLIYHED